MPLLGKKVNLFRIARASSRALLQFEPSVRVVGAGRWLVGIARGNAVRAMNALYDGIKTIRRDACSAVGIVRARTPHALPTMLALRRGSRRLDLVAQQRGT